MNFLNFGLLLESLNHQVFYESEGLYSRGIEKLERCSSN